MTNSGADRRYGGALVSSRRSERRERFLEAGIAVFGTAGYHGTSISNICVEAKLSRAQFYEHFADREELLVAVYDRIQLEAREHVVRALGTRTVGLENRLRAAVTAYAASIGTDPRRAAISFVEIVGISERVEQHRVQQREQWARFLEAEMCAELGESFRPPGGFATAVTGFIGALMALVQQWSALSPHPPLDDLIEVLTRFLTSISE